MLARHNTVIYNGVDTDKFTDTTTREQRAATRRVFGFAESDFVIGALGGLHKEKNQIELVAAVERLRGIGVPARALLIGDGAQRNEIHACARERGVSRDIAITGFVHDVRPFVAASDTVAVCSVTEGMSLASLEAMALCKPVVHSNVGGAAEMIHPGYNGFLFRANDTAALVEHLARLTNRNDRQSIGAHARGIVERRFSERRMIESYESLLLNLTTGSNGRRSKSYTRGTERRPGQWQWVMTPHLMRDSEVRESASNAAAEHGPSGAARSYLNRLRCMTPAEISYRVVHKLRTWVEPWLDQESDRYEAPTLGRDGRPWVHLDAPVGGAPYLAAADRVLSDKHDLLALRDVELGAPPHWNRDPKTGVEAPLVPGMRLNCRDRRLVGDVRYLWEPNRHMHLVTLAQAYRFSGDLRYLGVIRQHIASWLEACPYGNGPNWANAFEPAVRLINWSITWQLLGAAESMLFSDATGTELRLHWLESVHQHCRFVRRHFSRYSSANHQLVGEAAGLFIAALTWPYWPDSDGWALDAAAVLEREIQEQNFRDGVNREQSVGYQQLELDLLLFAWLAGEASGRPFSATFRARFEAMLEYLASLMDYGGHLPMIGDSDDGLRGEIVPRAFLLALPLSIGVGRLVVPASRLQGQSGNARRQNALAIRAACRGVVCSLGLGRLRRPRAAPRIRRRRLLHPRVRLRDATRDSSASSTPARSGSERSPPTATPTR